MDQPVGWFLFSVRRATKSLLERKKNAVVKPGLRPRDLPSTSGMLYPLSYPCHLMSPVKPHMYNFWWLAKIKLVILFLLYFVLLLQAHTYIIKTLVVILWSMSHFFLLFLFLTLFLSLFYKKRRNNNITFPLSDYPFCFRYLSSVLFFVDKALIYIFRCMGY